MRYPEQLSLQLNKTVDATPEECIEWEKKDFFRSGQFDAMKLFVVVPTLIQLLMIGLMFGIFALNQHLF